MSHGHSLSEVHESHLDHGRPVHLEERREGQVHLSPQVLHQRQAPDTRCAHRVFTVQELLHWNSAISTPRGAALQSCHHCMQCSCR